MPDFYSSDNYMGWEEERNSANCPHEKTLWINSAYIENANDVIEILNEALNCNIIFIKIEKQLLEDTIYAKVNVGGSACCILRNNVFNLLKKIHFSIKTEVEESTKCISLIVIVKSEQQEDKKIIIRKETDILRREWRSRKGTYENVVKILKLLLCHVIIINPAQGNSKIVERVFGKLDEKTRELFKEILNTTFIKAFIHIYEGDCRCLNPFAPLLRKDFEEGYFESMWALEQQFSISGVSEAEQKLIQSVRENKKFKSYLELNVQSIIYRFSPLKIKYLEKDAGALQIDGMDAEWRSNSKSKVSLNGELKALDKLLPREMTQCLKEKLFITREHLSKEDLRLFGDKIIEKEYKLRELTSEDKITYQSTINASESQWLSRFQMFIKQLNKASKTDQLNETSEGNYPSWQKDVDNHQLSLNTEESIKNLKSYLKGAAENSDCTEYDIIQKLATKIDFRRRKITERDGETYEEAIDESKLSIILGILLNFIKNNADWDKLANQCIRIYCSKGPDEVKVKGKHGKQKIFMDLIHDLETSKMEKRLIDAYLEDLYLAILKKGNSGSYQLLMKHKYPNIALSEEIASIGNYKQNDMKTPLREISAQIGKEQTCTTKN